ncbi:MAG TPA: hypothetical protein VK925_08245 [Jiangellaceae bacterium]|nr:hypothetical protein [Jiangellaceae bacterium]
MDDIEVTGSPVPHGADILTGAAVQFVSELHREFGRRRTELLAARWACRPVTTELVPGIIATEYERLQDTASDRLADARQLLEQVVLGENDADFLTLPAYELIVTEDGR